MKARLLALAALVALMLAVGGTAVAVSDGNYDPEEQHCTGAANSHDHEDEVEEGCTNFIIHVGDTDGDEYGSVGLQQQPEGSMPGPDDVVVTGAEPGASPADGFSFYIGADDNLNVGEHDGSSDVNNGPSDGGAIVFNVDPETVGAWLDALGSGDVAYLLTHPVPLVDAGAGMCADGVCLSVQTTQRVAFQGGDESKERDVSDYEGKEWDPESCSGPSDQPEDCGGRTMADWVNDEGTTYVEPGVQVYEDPDPQGSPLGPYPLPAAYVGTCGVILGGGPAAQMPDSPVTNSAGQIEIETGCHG